MADKINGRTPEEIKKGLECCGREECTGCPYDHVCEIHYVTCAKDALAYIQQLERERDQYKRERDAAVQDMAQAAIYLCCACKKYHHNAPGKDNHSCEMFEDSEGFERVMACDLFEWRGVQEDKT